MKIGIITDCLKTDLESAIKAAAKLDVQAVQIYATNGAFSPDELSDENKQSYKDLLNRNDLAISALCADMGGYGFEIEKDNPDRIIKTKRIIDLATEFGTNIITTHIGVIPEDVNSKIFKTMQSALIECGRYARSKGVTLAIETGPEKAIILKTFLDSIPEGVGVNLDPANFVMVTGQDPVEAVYILKDYIVHTHVKDGIKINSDLTPSQVYHSFAVGGIDALNALKGFKEVPIGKGQVDWDNYLKALKSIGYIGYLTIEREAGDDPLEDISQAVNFITNKLKALL